MATGKPVPVPDLDSAEYWRATTEGRLLLQRCRGCGGLQHYPRRLCVRCHGSDLEWQASSGRGTVYSFTVIRRAPSTAFAADVPYVLALVELEGGTRLMTTLADTAPEDVSIGMPVKVRFDPVADGIALPRFARDAA